MGARGDVGGGEGERMREGVGEAGEGEAVGILDVGDEEVEGGGAEGGGVGRVPRSGLGVRESILLVCR